MGSTKGIRIGGKDNGANRKNSRNKKVSKKNENLDQEEIDFINGDFSAKYHIRKNSIEFESDNKKNDFEKEEPLNTTNVLSSTPLKITGGFSGLNLAKENIIEHNQNIVPRSTLEKKRRKSILSNMLSSSANTSKNGLRDRPASENSSFVTQNLGLTGNDDNKDKDGDKEQQPIVDVNNPNQEVLDTVNRHLVNQNDLVSNASMLPLKSNNSASISSSNVQQQQQQQSALKEGFDSLQLAGGDITREIYNWAERHNPGTIHNESSSAFGSPIKKSSSFGEFGNNKNLKKAISKNNNIEGSDDHYNTFDEAVGSEDELMSVSDIKVPGGFRRSFIAQKYRNKQLAREQNEGNSNALWRGKRSSKKVSKPNFFTSNFIEFLTLYGHFAGEDLRDDEESNFPQSSDTENYSTEQEDDTDNNSQFSDLENNVVSDDEFNHNNQNTSNLHMERALLQKNAKFAIDRYNSFGSAGSHNTSDLQFRYQLQKQNAQILKQRKQRIKRKERLKDSYSSVKKASTFKTFLLLLKAFIGTGVLFLPKSFSNGGLIFSNLMLLVFSLLSYYCFVVLINVRLITNVSSYGNIGLILYGQNFERLILLCIILSQIGFSSAYIVFVGENFKSLYTQFFSAGSNLNIVYFIFLQLLIFIPLSLTRKIAKLSFTALIADFFILLGLLYVYYYSAFNIFQEGIDLNNLQYLNRSDWPLFIGTAVFTYEGIGLLIPIQESMKRPQDFNKILAIVIGIVTIIFVTIGTLCYLSFGDDVQTVILLNFPKDSILVRVIQLLYAIAILLSTPLQLFPAIKIIENFIFKKRDEEENHDNVDSNLYFSEEYNNNDNRERNSLLSPLRSSRSNASQYGSSNQTNLQLAERIEEAGDKVLSGKNDPVVKSQKNLTRVAIVLMTCLIAFFGSNDLDKFVSLVGSFTCIPLIYIFPPLLHLKLLNTDSFKEQDTGSLHRRLKVIDYIILALGIIIMIYTSYQNLGSWIR